MTEAFCPVFATHNAQEDAKRFAREIYDKYCPKVVKKTMGSRRMVRRLSKIVMRMIGKYRLNLANAKECYISIEHDDGEEVTYTKVFFNEKTYPFEKLVDIMDDETNLPDEMNFRLLVQVKKNHCMRETYNVSTLFYQNMLDSVYSLHRCMALSDVFSDLGYEYHYDPLDDTFDCVNIHKDFLAFCATNCS